MFLDEIGEMSPKLQAKLLQVLQDGEFSRLGGDVDVHVDVRVLAATNRDLEDRSARAAFREDLYYRLNVVNVYVPPLRERSERSRCWSTTSAQYSAKYGREPAASRPADAGFSSTRGRATCASSRTWSSASSSCRARKRSRRRSSGRRRGGRGLRTR